MASIQTAIMLTDRVTNPMRNICNALNMTISNFERLQEASGDSMSNIKFDNIRAEINQANASMIQLSDEINNAANKIYAQTEIFSGIILYVRIIMNPVWS